MSAKRFGMILDDIDKRSEEIYNNLAKFLQ